MNLIRQEKLLSSELKFNGSLIKVKLDTVKLTSGLKTTREVVQHNPAVVIVPINHENNVILIRQFRYPVNEVLLEAPAGTIEKEESPENCARRELQEETGYLPRKLEYLGQFWTAPGFCDELIYAYVARDLVPSKLPSDPDENIITDIVPFSDVISMINNGKIRDAKTISAILMTFQILSD